VSELYIAQADLRPLTPTHHALFYSLSTILTFMKQRLAAAVNSSREVDDEGAAPWLRRVLDLENVYELSMALCEVMCWVRFFKPCTG
jgi:hypothetical protein